MFLSPLPLTDRIFGDVQVTGENGLTYRFSIIISDRRVALFMKTAILISKSNNLYRQKKRFNRWQNCDRQSVLDGCNFSYSVIMRVMTFLVGVLKSASSIKMRIAVMKILGWFFQYYILSLTSPQRKK
jgi:hypothetical protein